jgi:hypothetical protein
MTIARLDLQGFDMKTELFAALCLSFCCSAVTAAAPLLVHEWGTFTSFQDPEGATIAGVNIDDEPVPGFVHRLDRVPIFGSANLPARWSQGAPSCHPDVTMRLETPVVYFYPPSGWQAEPFDVSATFVGGWLTEYYPAAVTDEARFPYTLDETTRGSLLWRQVQLGAVPGIAMEDTTEHVWLAPRKVQSSIIVSPDAREAEKYLFYRGVGQVDAPLVFRAGQGSIDIALRPGSTLTALPRIWLVEVLPDGRVRFQTVDGNMSASVPAFAPATPGTKSDLVRLRAELAKALTAEGLFPDEAAAMLATWQLSYFDSEGLRAFFLLPRAWIDAHLPLAISTPAELTRVMVGRVELVSAYQHSMLEKLRALPQSATPVQPLYASDPALLRAGLSFTDSGPLSKLYRKFGHEVPESLLAYESLGRFRDALLGHEMQREPDATLRSKLKRVIAAYSACVPVPPGPPEPVAAN